MTTDVRQAEITRNTKETQIRVKVNLDGRGAARLSTGLPFLEHMREGGEKPSDAAGAPAPQVTGKTVEGEVKSKTEHKA